MFGSDCCYVCSGLCHLGSFFRHRKSADTGPGRSDLVARRVARLSENANTLACSAQQVVEGTMKLEGGEREERKWRREKGRTQLLRSKTPSSEKSKTELLRSWIFFFEKTCFQKFVGRTVCGLCRPHGTSDLCCLPDWHLGHAQRRLRPPPCCGWCVIGFALRRSVCAQVADDGVCVLSVLWCAAASP